MDRQIIYPGQIAVETDLLNTNRNTMISIGKLAGALFGTGGVTNGLVVGPSSPAALTVDVAPGEIYQLENVDNTDYSSLPADTTDAVVKQGIALAKQTLSCAAPGTAGFSINYLIQAAYQDSDTGAVALPYYNASNPAQAYSGPNNSGATQATKRAGIVVVNAKAGTAATTGTQTTPAPDSGYIALASVTVANGQATIIAGDITAIAPSSPPMVDTSAIYADLASTAAGKGSKLVAFIQRLTGAVARWVEDKLAESVSVKDFGAVGDNVADDTAAFQAALNTGRKVKIPFGSHKLTAGLTMSASGGLFGMGRKRSILNFTLASGSTANLISINAGNTGAWYGNDLHDFSIVDATPSPATTGIYAENLTQASIHDITITGVYNGVRTYLGSLNTLRDVLVTGSSGDHASAVGFTFDNAAWYVDNCYAIESSTPALQSGTGFLWKGGAVPEMIHGGTYGCAIGGHFTVPLATSAYWGSLRHVEFDTGSNTGFLLDLAGATSFAYGLELTGLWASTFGVYGVHVVQGSGVIDGVEMTGGRIIGSLASGLYFESGSNITLTGVQVGGNGNSSAAGILVGAGVTGFSMSGCRSGQMFGKANTQTYGLQVIAGAQNISVVGNDLQGNISQGYVSASTSASQQYANNAGTSNLFQGTVPSAATLSFGSLSDVTIGLSGTTSIVTMNNGYEGAHITLIKADAGTIATTTAGNFAAVYSLPQGGSLVCKFTNGKWYCK